MSNCETYLADRIVNSYDFDGYTGALIYGAKGSGKSTFAMLSLHDVFTNEFNMADGEAWDKVLEHVLFDLDVIIEKLEYYRNKNDRAVGLILDDVGVYFSGLLYNQRQKEHAKLKGMMDTIRTATSSLLMTTPSFDSLIGYLKSEDNFRIQIIKQNSRYSRMARIYKKVTLPSGTTRIYKRGETPFQCKIPDRIYQTYKEKRDNYFDQLASEFDQLEDRSKS